MFKLGDILELQPEYGLTNIDDKRKKFLISKNFFVVESIITERIIKVHGFDNFFNVNRFYKSSIYQASCKEYWKPKIPKLKEFLE